MKVGVGVPVMLNFEGFTKLMKSIERNDFRLYIRQNWEENIGVAAAWNGFLDQAIFDEVDALFILNDDVTFHTGAFQGALYAWKDRPKDAICLTGSYGLGYEYRLNGGDFSAFLIDPREVRNEIGYFDAENFPTYHEDNDFAYRAKLIDRYPYAHGLFSVNHEGSKTQFWYGKDKGIVSHDKFREGQKNYREKWGGLPGKEKFITPYNMIGVEE